MATALVNKLSEFAITDTVLYIGKRMLKNAHQISALFVAYNYICKAYVKYYYTWPYRGHTTTTNE